MTEVLKLTELTEDDRMAQVEVGSAGIAAKLNVEGLFRLEGVLDFSGELFFGDDLGDATPNHIHLLIEGWEQRLGRSKVYL